MKINSYKIIKEWMDLGHEFGIFQSWTVRLGSRTEPIQFYGFRATMHWDDNESFHAFVHWPSVVNSAKKLGMDGVGFILAEHCDYHKQGAKLYKPSVWYLASYSTKTDHTFQHVHMAQFRPTKFDLYFHTYQHVEVQNVFEKEFEVLR